MATIKDLRSITPRTNGTRSESAIKKIARHHSATTDGSWAAFWNHWSGPGLRWGTGGYHEIILRDGTVELCYDPHEITNGVGGQNSYIYNICVVGNGSFTDAQEKAFDERCKIAMARFNLKASDVLGHNEFPKHATSCPGINMDAVRKRLSDSVVEQASKPKPTPEPSKPTPKPKPTAKPKEGLAIDGSFGPATIRALQRYFGGITDGVISKPSNVIKSLQKLLGVAQDGYFGPATIRALQRRFGTIQDGIISRPSNVIKELQRRLNKGKL